MAFWRMGCNFLVILCIISNVSCDCDLVLTEEEGTFTSPGFPSLYPDNSKCTYRIELPPGKKISLIFKNVSIDDCFGECCDKVEIYDGDSINSPLIDTLCGNYGDDGIALLSSGETLLITFNSDSNRTNTGFIAEYVAVDADEILTSDAGVVTSPKYPSNYPENAHYTYIIEVQPGYMVKLEFSVLRLESTDYYCYDYLEIRDGKSANCPLVGIYCGYEVPPTVFSSGNSLRMLFYSDNFMGNLGFSATYHAVANVPEGYCDEYLSGDAGNITSPSYPSHYPQGANCFYVIEVPPGYVIQLEFADFKLGNEASCGFDHVEIRDGYNFFSPLLGTYCGNTTPPKVISSQNVLWILFSSIDGGQNQGFRAKYEAVNNVPESCDELLTADAGNFTSPNYPSKYPSLVQCTYMIQVRPGYRIELAFTKFKINYDFGCDQDFVEIRDGNSSNSPLIRKNCGLSQVPPPVISSGNALWVQFESSIFDNEQGFIAAYQAVLESGDD